MALTLGLSGCGLSLTDGKSTEQGGEAAARLFALTFKGTGFGSSHANQELALALVDRNAGSVRVLPELALTGDEVTATYAEVLTEGHEYYLDTFVDNNANGACDAPPTDHAWRRKLAVVAGDLEVTEKHRMGFFDVCGSFSGKGPDQPGAGALTVSGLLKLDAGLAEPAGGLSAGAPLADAVVFLEGDPSRETRTDASGAFVLAIDPGAALALGPEPALVAWYTVPAPGKSAEEWDAATARYGTRRTLDLSQGQSGALALGDLSLTYTQALSLSVKSAADGAAVDGCWVNFVDYGFQLVVLGKGKGQYFVDYLPAGTYNVRLDCHGFEPLDTQVVVNAATTAGEVQDVPAFELSPQAATLK